MTSCSASRRCLLMLCVSMSVTAVTAMHVSTCAAPVCESWQWRLGTKLASRRLSSLQTVLSLLPRKWHVCEDKLRVLDARGYRFSRAAWIHTAPSISAHSPQCAECAGHNLSSVIMYRSRGKVPAKLRARDCAASTSRHERFVTVDYRARCATCLTSIIISWGRGPSTPPRASISLRRSKSSN